MALMIVVASPLSGRIVGRRGPRVPLVIAGVCCITACAMLTGIDPATPFARLIAAYVIFGIGFGFVNAPITNAAVSGMPRAQAGVASAIATTSRQFGQTLGVAVVGRDRRLTAGGPAHADLPSASRPGLVGADGAAACSCCCSVSRPPPAGRGSRRGARRPSSIRKHSLVRLRRNRPADDRHATTPRRRPREVWLLISDLVLDNQRRREVSDALGMSFGRSRALRRLARRPMSMGELAAALEIDPANATVVVDDLEALGLVRRRPHSTDRRAKVVEPTRKGKDLARRADAILAKPPPALSSLGGDDLQALLRILRSATAPE